VDHASASDERLHAALANRDVAALDELYARYAARCFPVVHWLAPDRASAEAILEAVFLDLWRHPERVTRATCTVEQWLLAECHRRAVVARRAAGLPLPSLPPLSALASSSTVAWAVAESLAELPEFQRLPLELAYFGGLDRAAIASRTDDSAAAIRTRLRVALTKLRALLAQRRLLVEE